MPLRRRIDQPTGFGAGGGIEAVVLARLCLRPTGVNDNMVWVPTGRMRRWCSGLRWAGELGKLEVEWLR
jgi:hypothetical protein